MSKFIDNLFGIVSDVGSKSNGYCTKGGGGTVHNTTVHAKHNYCFMTLLPVLVLFVPTILFVAVLFMKYYSYSAVHDTTVHALLFATVTVYTNMTWHV
jgi:hypothetical protein